MLLGDTYLFMALFYTLLQVRWNKFDPVNKTSLWMTTCKNEWNFSSWNLRHRAPPAHAVYCLSVIALICSATLLRAFLNVCPRANKAAISFRLFCMLYSVEAFTAFAFVHICRNKTQLHNNKRTIRVRMKELILGCACAWLVIKSCVQSLSVKRPSKAVKYKWMCLLTCTFFSTTDLK